MSCTTTGCPSGQRCFQISFNEYRCVNNVTKRGGTVLDINPVYAKATATLDQMINEAISGGSKKKKDTGELDRLIDRATDNKKKKDKDEDEDKDKKSDKKDEDEEEKTTTPAKTTPTTAGITPAVSTTPPVATTTGGFNPQKALEWLKANPAFTVIAAGLVIYSLVRMGK